MSNPKSLFIQVNTSNSSLLQTALEHIRQEHRDTNESDIIYNVVLTDILDGNGNPDPRLEIIRPYLPGGATPAFDNVFVGVGNTDYTGSNGTLPPWQATSPYAAGIKDPAFRWSNLIRQKDAWLKFSQWYGGSMFHGYVGYEAVLSWWTNNSIAQAYEAYLIQSVIDLHSVAPGSAVLWSPSIWDRWTWGAHRDSGEKERSYGGSHPHHLFVDVAQRVETRDGLLPQEVGQVIDGARDGIIVTAVVDIHHETAVDLHVINR